MLLLQCVCDCRMTLLFEGTERKVVVLTPSCSGLFLMGLLPMLNGANAGNQLMSALTKESLENI